MDISSHSDMHRLSVDDALRRLNTHRTGLTSTEAQRRLSQFGPNVLARPDQGSLVRGIVRQFTHFLAVLLWIAAGLSFLGGYFNPKEDTTMIGWSIIGVIVLNAAFTFVQEYRAERTLTALRRLLPTLSWVVREGREGEVPREQLVPGDLLLLDEGQQVPADARLIEVIGLRVDLSSLTGESSAKSRTAEPVLDGDVLGASNLVFAGTTVVSGHGRAVVYGTGIQTEFGKVANLTTATPAGISPLQREVTHVAHVVVVISVFMGLSFFALGWWLGLGLWISAIFGIGIIVAYVPEGLLPTLTLSLAMASQRMAKRQALIKHLPSVETLGSTTVICTDKTGTLTENHMKVDRLFIDQFEVASRNNCLIIGGRVCPGAEIEQWKPLFDAISHCHNVKRGKHGDGRTAFTGDPTEVALVEFAHEHGLLHREPQPRMGELPFDADRKRMTTFHWREGRLVAYVKGAPESLLPLCTTQLHQNQPIDLTTDQRQDLLLRSRTYAQQAYRVLAVAMREVPSGTAQLRIEDVEQDLTFLGLVALIDPPRREVPEAIQRCRRAGIRVIMLTGDHPATALAIGRHIGLSKPDKTMHHHKLTFVVEGPALDKLTDDQLRQLLTPTTPDEMDPIFARMAPRHKMRIVSMLRERGDIVAVTGDGVNDAPALKHADIGIAMGLAGTDVAKESADMILLDDNFATIVNAVEEGRAVYANIRKFVSYVLTSNLAEAVPYIAFGLFAIPVPLTVLQILAIDLGTNVLPALALGAERPHAGIMKMPPRPRNERLMNRSLVLRAYGFLGLIEGLVALGAFFCFLLSQGWSWGEPLDWSSPLYRQATTVTFAAIVTGQIANAFACRSERLSVTQLGWRDNHMLLWGIGSEIALLVFFIYTPWGHALLSTAAFPLWIWPILVVGALLLLLAEEGRKYLAGRIWQFIPHGLVARLGHTNAASQTQPSAHRPEA
jgi:sodium/potassium-transporting ATPase subunit alpha